MAETVLRTEGPTKRFGGVAAVDAVTLALTPGELVAVIGPNGAGKTTLVDLLAGELAPDDGTTELAMALAGAPRLLLLDEPMAGIGSGGSEAVIRFLAALKGRFAVLLVEHDMAAVFALADRILVLESGRLVAAGPPAAVRTDPAVRAAYLGDDALAWRAPPRAARCCAWPGSRSPMARARCCSGSISSSRPARW